jgi:UMF1 family MFS transporter
VFDRFGGIGGMTIFTLSVALTGSSRQAILSVAAFFAIGVPLRGLVDVEHGRRVAIEAEPNVRSV